MLSAEIAFSTARDIVGENNRALGATVLSCEKNMAGVTEITSTVHKDLGFPCGARALDVFSVLKHWLFRSRRADAHKLNGLLLYTVRIAHLGFEPGHDFDQHIDRLGLSEALNVTFPEDIPRLNLRLLRHEAHATQANAGRFPARGRIAEGLVVGARPAVLAAFVIWFYAGQN